jgi:hypothetical protein
VFVELVAKDQQQVTAPGGVAGSFRWRYDIVRHRGHWVLPFGFDLAARHASEQYLTSAQFFAQLLRQVICRPQITQILQGRSALLPLKPVMFGAFN